MKKPLGRSWSKAGYAPLSTPPAQEGAPPPSPTDREASRGVEGRKRIPIKIQKEGPSRRPEAQGVYIISVAARLLQMHPQTLRKYERMGLVSPSRTEGMLRLYSEEDIARLRLIKHLVENMGLNLAGVDMALEVFERLLEVRARLASFLEDERARGLVEDELEKVLKALSPFSWEELT